MAAPLLQQFSLSLSPSLEKKTPDDEYDRQLNAYDSVDKCPENRLSGTVPVPSAPSPADVAHELFRNGLHTHFQD
jgi:hypothetical protein